jgi:hypothetical protein
MLLLYSLCCCSSQLLLLPLSLHHRNRTRRAIAIIIVVIVTVSVPVFLSTCQYQLSLVNIPFILPTKYTHYTTQKTNEKEEEEAK